VTHGTNAFSDSATKQLGKHKLAEVEKLATGRTASLRLWNWCPNSRDHVRLPVAKFHQFWFQ
jgi:hypothetical protein